MLLPRQADNLYAFVPSYVCRVPTNLHTTLAYKQNQKRRIVSLYSRAQIVCRRYDRIETKQAKAYKHKEKNCLSDILRLETLVKIRSQDFNRIEYSSAGKNMHFPVLSYFN